jgi:Tol biopolymer transport system component
MGEVYRARDTKLDRDVAVKILPPHFAQDQDRLARFEREAKAVAALSHPNILAIHDFGRHDGTTYAVMELLEGNTLRERLAGGALPQRKAVEYAAQIASGLSGAHDKGIVHRDLKPDNLFVTSDGRVKILDFGLAALVEASPEDLSQSPTRERPTDPGTVLGTVGYMSPEQARGQRGDGRSDVFSLGCVLYEMLSGKRAFRRETTAETLTAILREDPPSLAEVTPPLPASLERMLLHCLEKRPGDRFQSARDLAFDLQAMSDPSASGTGSRARGPIPTRGRLRWLWPAGMLAAGVALGALLVREPSTTLGQRQATFADIAPPAGVRLFGDVRRVRLSEDGRQLVFAGSEKDGVQRLWLRDLDSGVTRALPGTEGASSVAWSRDGRRILYRASDNVALKELEISTGAIRAVAAIPPGLYFSTGAWNESGDLLLGAGGGLFHVAPAGGNPQLVAPTDPARGETILDVPQFLPDGRHYLFSAFSLKPDQSGAYIGVLGSGERRLLLPSVQWAAYAPPGYLVFRRESVVFAQRFDPARLEPSGEPHRLVDGVLVNPWGWPASWVAGDTLVYVSGTAPRFQLTWFDRAGRESSRVGEPADLITFDLSPDGARVIAAVHNPGSLWLIDTSTGATKVVTQGGADVDPRFGSDAQSVLFASWMPGQRGLFRMSLSGGSRVPILPAPQGPHSQGLTLHDWSRDGRLALYTQGLEQNIRSIPVSGNGPAQPVVEGGAGVDEARFSPDGRWVAYNSDQTGRDEVFVVPFPPTGEQWQVSTGGGVQPLWRDDGRELFYLDPTGNLMSVEVTASRTFAHRSPRVLFRTGIVEPNSSIDDYAVTADGRRFLFKLPAATNTEPQLKMILDWPALLEKQKQTRASGGSPP